MVETEFYKLWSLFKEKNDSKLNISRMNKVIKTHHKFKQFYPVLLKYNCHTAVYKFKGLQHDNLHHEMSAPVNLLNICYLI